MIDRLRDLATQAAQTRHYTPVALSANDPANVWGNLLPWPTHPATLVPTRRAGALVVVSGGKLLLYLAQGGKKMLVWQEKEELLRPRGFPRADYRTASRTTAALYANRSE